LASSRFGRTGVIDFGCADGILLPSLSKHFPHVLAVDNNPNYVDQSRNIVDALGLKNVSLICNADLSFAALRESVPQADYGVAFLLETLEHVGDVRRLYQSKMDFLANIFSLLEHDGIVVISVPKMVGYGFLLKYVTQIALRLPTEKMRLRELYRSAVLGDTEELERRWSGTHIGFSHLKLETHLKRCFHILHRTETLISAFYVVQRSDKTYDFQGSH
jgi:2-polyprenyl-3-methyl-5-hydroxy-6-metoxy-1,4-benzoquinol methylase